MTIGVVLMAYGTPATPDEILPYYTDIRRGRPPTPEQLDELTRRYAAIGGLSPLLERTEAQRRAVQTALDESSPGRHTVVLGMKHAEPRIETAVGELVRRGVTEIVGAVLAPHYSAYSVGEYLARLNAAADEHGVPARAVESWATEPAFVTFLAADVQRRLAQMPHDSQVVFTAHSLPTRILDTGDRYPDEVRATAEAVTGELGLTEGEHWQLAWQSAGRTPEPWLGPDVLDVIRETDAAGVLVCACGFVADHLEVLYDLDIDARRVADERGVAFDRTACVNDDRQVMTALAARIAAA